MSPFRLLTAKFAGAMDKPMEGVAKGSVLTRAALAAALMYVLALKAILAPLAQGHVGFEAAPFVNVICAHDGTGETPPANQWPARDASCCDEGCVFRIAGFAAPLIVAIAIAFDRLAPVDRPAAQRSLRVATGPPGKIAAQPNAQRAPPQIA
jgi:hypothetical protein